MFTLLAALALANDPFAVSARTVTLPNGLIVVVEEQRRTDTVAVHLAYGVGARDEAAKELGCAHLFEHLMFEKTAHIPQDSFDKWLTAAGGSNNAWTSEDTTAYHETFPSGALDLVLFLESDRMGFLDTGLDEENLKNQIAVVLQERAEGYAEPGGRDWDALTRLMWPADHPYHHPVIGEVGTVQGFTLSGVSEFWSTHYGPENAVLAIVGNIDADAAIAKAETWFSDVPAQNDWRFRESPTPLVPRTGPVFGSLEDDVEQRSLYLAWRGPQHGHIDEPALDVATAILSGGHGTRLDDSLVYDRSLANEVGSYASMGDLAGVLVFYVRADDTPLTKLREVVHKEIERLGRKGPNAEELERARRSIRASMLLELEDPAGRAGRIADCMKTAGRPDCDGAEWKRYEAVTAEQVALAVRTWLDRASVAALSVIPTGDDGALPGSAPVDLP